MSQQEDRPYMLVYKDKWRALTDTLTKAERNKVMAAFFDWLTFGDEPKGLTRIGRGFFEFLKTSEENGKKRGAPFGNSNRRNNSDIIENSIPNSNQDELKNQKNIQCSTDAKAYADAYAKAESESNTEELNDARLISEMRKFAKEKKLKVNVTRFFNYYKARGWMINGAHIKDWRPVLHSWAENGIKDEPDYEPDAPKVRTPFTKCPKCGSEDVEQRGDMALCHNPECNRSFDWRGGDWREEK